MERIGRYKQLLGEREAAYRLRKEKDMHGMEDDEIYGRGPCRARLGSNCLYERQRSMSPLVKVAR